MEESIMDYCEMHYNERIVSEDVMKHILAESKYKYITETPSYIMELVKQIIGTDDKGKQDNFIDLSIEPEIIEDDCSARTIQGQRLFDSERRLLLCKVIFEFFNYDEMAFILPNTDISSPVSIAIRQEIWNKGLIKDIITLPSRIYPTTTASFSLMIMSNDNRFTTLVEARSFYKPDRKKGRRLNVLTDDNICSIINALNNQIDNISIRIRREEIDYYEMILAPKKYLSIENEEDLVEFGEVISNITRGKQLKGVELDNLMDNKTEHFKGYKYLTPAGISYGNIDDDIPSLNDRTQKYSNYCARKGCLIITKNSENFKVAVAERDNILVSSNLYCITMEQFTLNPYYIKAYLESNEGIQMLKNISSGGVLPMLTVSAIKKIRIPLLSKDKMEEIADDNKSICIEIAEKEKEITERAEEKKNLFN